MQQANFDNLVSEIKTVRTVVRSGRVCKTGTSVLTVEGLQPFARIGDLVEVCAGDTPGLGEVLSFDATKTVVLPEAGTAGISQGDRVSLIGAAGIAPDRSWLGRLIDPFGRPLDGRGLFRGPVEMPSKSAPPKAAKRRRLGARMNTGMAAFNTFFPILRGQRLGLFAGSGVGKSTLLADLAKGVDADVVVLALIGERGRELREFVEDTLGPEGMKRAVVIAATSDQSPLIRRRAAWTAMCVAEYFRNLGGHVLLLADSLTRFAEAHREIATATGEAANLRGFPPSTSQLIMEYCERAGPGMDGMGDITALFSVLVAGSDMEEPIADTTRGVLDGHIVMDRKIAEGGRFPAIDVLRSVSRSLPAAATLDENTTLGAARAHMSAFAQSALMIRAGLYQPGSDAVIDQAIAARPGLEQFLTEKNHADVAASFARLQACLEPAALQQGQGD